LTDAPIDPVQRGTKSPVEDPLHQGGTLTGPGEPLNVPGLPAQPTELERAYETGLEMQARSQWTYARRRFVRHRLAMGALVILAVVFLAGAFANYVAKYKYDYQDPNLLGIGTGPTFHDWHIFGTDRLGRDYFSRVIYGIRTSESVSLFVALLSTAIGVVVGSVAGYFGGWVDNLLMRFTDLVLTIPVLALLLCASALLGGGHPYRIGFILALVFWTTLARVVRGSFLSLREKEYVEAAKASGSGDIRIMVRHMLPNALGPIIVNTTLLIGTAILFEAVLSFLGFGIKPPTAALGALIATGQSEPAGEWWLVVFPGLTIVLIVLCINFLGDGLRDALDPTQRRIRA
jgi:peptide/nickel transport system permease protein